MVDRSTSRALPSVVSPSGERFAGGERVCIEEDPVTTHPPVDETPSRDGKTLSPLEQQLMQSIGKWPQAPPAGAQSAALTTSNLHELDLCGCGDKWKGEATAGLWNAHDRHTFDGELRRRGQTGMSRN